MLPLLSALPLSGFKGCALSKPSSLPSVEARHPCQTSELAHSAIEAMRPISMAQNDLLHGPPQSVHDNHLHVFPLALTFVLRIEYGVLSFNSAFMACQWFEALCSILSTCTNISREPKVEASPGKCSASSTRSPFHISGITTCAASPPPRVLVGCRRL
ncbi:hypothetical protein GGI42DRAFT_284445 [Trichoderma sp. SZMC 28013]